MITKAAVLFALMILFALLSCASLIATVIGLVKKRMNLKLISLVVCLASVCLFSMTAVYTSQRIVNRASAAAQTLSGKATHRIVEFFDSSPGTWFTRFTGLEWPESARIIAAGDEYWVFEWEHYFIFEADHEVLEKWLSNPPPWGIEKWSIGPVPPEINYWSNGPHDKLTNSENIRYAAKEYCCSNLRFHSGDLIIIDPDSNRVWVASWDY